MATTAHWDRALDQWPHRSYNRGRWANDRGTLNLLGPESVARAMASVRTHHVLALGAPLREDEIISDAPTYNHRMLNAGRYRFSPDEPLHEASDYVGVDIHGMTNCHIDALCHVGYEGSAFNDVPFDEVATMDGALRLTIMDNPAIVTRAWMLDVPRLHGRDALRPGTPVTAEDLAHLEGRVQPGDAILVRTGRYATDIVHPDDEAAQDNHGNWSGMHVDTMDLLHAWDVSTLATDSSGDNFPSTTPDCTVPIHIIGEGYLGLPLMHHLQLEQLGQILAEQGRSDFMLMVAPLPIIGGTGSPVNPLAIL
jgi:kynurenine formamidase